MYFVVVSKQGPGWDPSKPMREQQLWPDHVTFVNGLMDDGFFLLGGPLAEGVDEGFSPASEPVGESRTYRTMVVVQGASYAEVVRRIEADPWVSAGVIERVSLDRWELLAGDLPS